MGKDVPWGTSKLCLAMCPIASRLRNILQKIKSQTRFQICFSRFHILYGWMYPCNWPGSWQWSLCRSHKKWLLCLKWMLGTMMDWSSTPKVPGWCHMPIMPHTSRGSQAFCPIHSLNEDPMEADNNWQPKHPSQNPFYQPGFTRPDRPRDPWDTDHSVLYMWQPPQPPP